MKSLNRKVIGFYGGTFDPIHFGHINLAIQLKEIEGLDTILFCPAFISPHKIEEPPKAQAKARYEMTALAIKNIPNFLVTDIEVKREKISYTIETIKQLVKEYPDSDFRLLISSENLPRFKEWKDVDELVKIAPPLIGSRSKFSSQSSKVVKIKEFDVTSTAIRYRLKKGLYCGHLVPAKVLDYIYTNHLYF